jgi:DNA-binding transcriptional regulator YiaG
MRDSQRLTAALDTMGWTMATFATIAAVPRQTVKNWAAGRGRPIPAPLLAWLEEMARLLSKNPPPETRLVRQRRVIINQEQTP